MYGLRADTSASHSNKALMGAEQNGLPPFEGSPRDKSKGNGKPFWSAPKGVALSDHDQPGACPKKIHEWTDRANISFEYTKKKINDLLTKAKKKMAEKLDCNQLECTQCNDSFPGESELRKHYHSEEHLAKVREKSESKTLGDLKTFARVRQFILSRIFGPSANHVPLQGHTEASLPPDQPSSPAATTEPPVVGPFDKLFVGELPPDESSTKGKPLENSFDDITELCAGFADDDSIPPIDSKLLPNEEETFEKVDPTVDFLQRENGDLKKENREQGEEIRKLKEELRKMREQSEQRKIDMSPKCLQQIVVEVKKDETKGDGLKEGDLGYELDNDKYYRIMDVLKQQYSSVQELVANLVTCSVKVNRKGGGYGERQSNGGRNEEEKASKKRKRADEAKM